MEKKHHGMSCKAMKAPKEMHHEEKHKKEEKKEHKKGHKK